MRPAEAILALREALVVRVLVAGNFIERDVVPFAISLVQAGLEPVLLFDVCGTLDPMAKWQSLANAVDEGVKVSTVQQTLGMLDRGDERRRAEAPHHRDPECSVRRACRRALGGLRRTS